MNPILKDQFGKCGRLELCNALCVPRPRGVSPRKKKKSPLFIFYVVVVVVVVIAVVVVVCIPLGRRLWRSREMIPR